MTAQDVMDELATHASDADAVNLQRFFKTGPGEYGEGDQFIGVRVPMTRKVCKEFHNLPLKEVRKLVESPIHEHRLAGLVILTLRYPMSHDKQAIYDLYIDELAKGNVNNWDLVDVSCHKIVGPHVEQDRTKLFELALSEKLWERRVSIISTFAFIAKGDATSSLEIAEILLHDTHDLIHKAVGWTLREVDKRVDRQLLLDFLDIHVTEMPRTALRYAIEHLPQETRQCYLKQR